MGSEEDKKSNIKKIWKRIGLIACLTCKYTGIFIIINAFNLNPKNLIFLNYSLKDAQLKSFRIEVVQQIIIVVTWFLTFVKKDWKTNTITFGVSQSLVVIARIYITLAMYVFMSGTFEGGIYADTVFSMIVLLCLESNVKLNIMIRIFSIHLGKILITLIQYFCMDGEEYRSELTMLIILIISIILGILGYPLFWAIKKLSDEKTEENDDQKEVTNKKEPREVKTMEMCASIFGIIVAPTVSVIIINKIIPQRFTNESQVIYLELFLIVWELIATIGATKLTEYLTDKDSENRGIFLWTLVAVSGILLIVFVSISELVQVKSACKEFWIHAIYPSLIIFLINCISSESQQNLSDIMKKKRGCENNIDFELPVHGTVTATTLGIEWYGATYPVVTSV